jgi:beta-lactamase superfamily II metal-dependent hydrolase
MTFLLTMYPAMDGDCIVLSWGEPSKLHHIVVDLGRGGTYKAIKSHLKALGDVELFVMSHIDADHIASAIPMVREKSVPFAHKRVWYNSRPQLVSAKDRHPILEPFGARQGEKLARGIVNFSSPWNGEFASEIVSTDSPGAKAPIPIAAGLKIRLLSPTDAGLAALLPQWDAELAKAKIRTFDPDEEENPLSLQFEPLGLPNVAKLASENYDRDRTEANGSAIAFIAEFNGKRVLLAADAHSEVLEAALAPLANAEGGRYRVNLLKVSHHGSKANTSKALPELIDCTRFAVSTNGDRHDHPDPQTIARFLMADKDREKIFYFNYRQPRTETWDSTHLKTKHKYDCVFPVLKSNDPGNGRLTIEI